MSASDVEPSERYSPRVLTKNYPYTSSIASSATSSSSSVFSADNQSSQSSAPSSSKSSLHAGWETEHPDSLAVADYQVASVDSTSQNAEHRVLQHVTVEARATEHAVAPELRQHPRRTSVPVNAQSGCTTARPPPSLIRQSDRKDNFVESLVDTTTQMIEVIWPLSVIPCGRDAVLGGKNLIDLRTFIQEVLKRSKTSYSTLQVALYYLILIKPHIPSVTFCMEQSEDSHAVRAMQCGRRMFLAALILASKYLQDRNYSARAWSKISGLKITEINSNEMAFVTAIDWRLHVSEPLFQRWTDVVLKFSPPASPSSPTFAVGASSPWRSVVPRLTPQLDNLDGLDVTRLSLRDSASPTSGHPLIYTCGKLSRTPPPAHFTQRSPSSSTSNQATPTPSNPKPMAMEPAVRDFAENRPRFPPISPKITLLPTPQLTPQSATFSTPAVSASGFCPAKSAMSYAWKQVQQNCLARTVDTWPPIACPNSGKAYAMLSRSSSLAWTASTVSSPESMMSDASARSSRSSSISSIASSTCALPQPSLAVQATRRCANMQLSCIKENCPVVVRSSPDVNPTWDGGLTSSPVSYTLGPKESYVRDCKVIPQPRPLVPEFSDRDAAQGLRDLALNLRARTLPPLITATSVPRKRERPSSMSDPTLQETVRGLLQSRSLNVEICQGSSVNGDDGTVLTDTALADSFTLNSVFKLPQLSTSSNVRDSSNNARKRACYMENHSRSMALGSEGLALAMPATGPGMWTGVL